jgi:hypothetical protein
LTATLDAYRRRDVEQAAEAAGMARGGDLFDAGHKLDDLLGDDGTVDAAKVAATAASVPLSARTAPSGHLPARRWTALRGGRVRSSRARGRR